MKANKVDLELSNKLVSQANSKAVFQANNKDTEWDTDTNNHGE